MKTSTAPTIRLEDYAPPKFRVATVDLSISLAPEDTRVVAVLEVERASAGFASLELDGDELKLVSLRANGVALDAADYVMSETTLSIPTEGFGDRFQVEIVTELAPVKNRKLMGLYQSKGVYCTQCEAQGFRRITFFPDRPDVLSVYTVRLEADQETCPVLLSNGNPGETGSLPGGRHFAIWHDPWPKPSYLFAAVAGALDCLSDTFSTASGRAVDLNIYVESGKAPLAAYAMDSLKRSMTWDEEAYGREYDLDVFNIVAVSDFNMGAMENKGLNVFNDKYILASSELATDTDFMNIEAIVAHEYFHNWTGNRITCRDWFQLCLKEGLTVYRDQEFSADQRSRAVQRIMQVRTLKAGQFSEDAGPLAHCVRPSSYKEINNFYTATVYQKGAELVRMLATLVGLEGYRKATDLYFERHDGDAAIMEDFLNCFEEATGKDLSQFMRWYDQAGTPEIQVSTTFDASAGTYEMQFVQTVPETPGQSEKVPMVVPIRFGFLGENGATLTPQTNHPSVSSDVITLTENVTSIIFENLTAEPVPSLLRGFSAPVRLTYAEGAEERTIRARHDGDLYNRWEALNGMALEGLSAMAQTGSGDTQLEHLTEMIGEMAMDETLESDFRAQVLTLPTQFDIARHLRSEVVPEQVATAHRTALASVGRQLGDEALGLCAKLAKQSGSDDGLDAAANRSLKNALLVPLAAAGLGHDFITAQFKTAKTMTDKLAALSMISQVMEDDGLREDAFASFFHSYCEHPLVIDKWYAMQAMVPGVDALDRVKSLSQRDEFTLDNPNRARSLLGTFAAGNLTGFHRQDGASYQYYVEQIVQMDTLNPQLAARMLTLTDNCKLMEAARLQCSTASFQWLAAQDGLSTDVREIIDRTLA